MKRRQFLTLSTAAAGVPLLGQCSSRASLQAQSSRSTSQGGLLDLALEARPVRAAIAGQSLNLLAYNGQIPGPMLEAKPGDTVQIRFKNGLTRETNLHYHGLHVPPTGNADNVSIHVPPGETQTYEFTIPEDHPAGTFWYHPHRHGLVADQVFGGLAGLFVVRGKLDEIPEVKAAKEEFLVLQDFDAAGSSGWRGNPMMQMMGREGAIVTANGQVNPSLSIPQGGLLRLRILNASPSRFYLLSLEDHPMHLIATDGGAIPEPVELAEVLLTPGERIEVLVRGSRPPGQYRLLNKPYNRGGMGGMMGRGMMGRGMMGRGMMGRGMMGNPSNSNTTETLATLSYGESVQTVPLPKQLLPVEALPEPVATQQFTLNHGMGRGRGMVFLINGQMFDPQRLDTRVKLGTVEEWEITTTGTMDHPFHVHTNHLQVVSRNGRPMPYRAWKDTVLVSRGETVRLRVPFRDFAGQTMYHCHILDHEDLGMMGILAIAG
ncbi:MAG: multicopper oxidase family protein [Limnospira sp.]